MDLICDNCGEKVYLNGDTLYETPDGHVYCYECAHTPI
jgi:formylmethanofuran dehydrogenase subunit E